MEQLIIERWLQKHAHGNSCYQRSRDGSAGKDLDLGDVFFLDHGKDAQGGEKEDAGAENDERKQPTEKGIAHPLF